MSSVSTKIIDITIALGENSRLAPSIIHNLNDGERFRKLLFEAADRLKTMLPSDLAPIVDTALFEKRQERGTSALQFLRRVAEVMEGRSSGYKDGHILKWP